MFPADVNGPFVFRPFERGTRDTARESGDPRERSQEATGGCSAAIAVSSRPRSAADG